MDLAGSSAVVVGGSSGLGYATAEMLSTRCEYVVVADLQQDRRTAVEAIGKNVRFVRTDVTDSEQVRGAVHEAASHAPLRVAVATAGVPGHGRILGSGGAMRIAEFERIVRVNLIGSAAVVVHAAEEMAGNDLVGEERGVIVLTSSIAALDGGNLGYAASKAGVAGMTLSAAHGLAPHGIRVMTIAPGIFNTPMFDGGRGTSEDLANMVPHPSRLGHPAEYAALVGHIADNAMLNGDVIRLDGSLRLPRLQGRAVSAARPDAELGGVLKLRP
ncbi:MAG TPA: SDR family NAD(P)-dependent oxidoreductase [Nocardioidaceae bacterium]|nr:SDR family NAD(P)-dependent oxidoreductase [Nocardioidaceae bacterium]